MPTNFKRVATNLDLLRPVPLEVPKPARARTKKPKGLSDAEIEFLRHIAINSKFSISPQRIQLPNGVKPMREHSPLSIATISTSLLFRAPVPPSLGEETDETNELFPNHFKTISRSNNRYRVFTLENFMSVDDLKGYLKQAVLDTGRALKAFEDSELDGGAPADTARLIVVNEFGFPFPLEQTERQAFLDDLAAEMVDDFDMQDFWASCYLVFGTYHCHNELKNSTVISLPYTPIIGGAHLDRDEQARALEFRRNIIGPDSAEAGGRFNFTQDKFVAAERVGERLVPRSSVDWSYYDTDMGRIGVLICFDALDPRMLLRLAKLRLSDTNIDIKEFSALIVPCFARDDRVLESCRLLSNVMDTLVVYVNVQYAKKGAKVFEIPSPANPQPTSQAFFYRGQELSGDMAGPDIISRGFEDPSPVDMDKNLWFTTRFCHLKRLALHEKHLVRAPFSSTFNTIVDARLPTATEKPKAVRKRAMRG